MNAAGKRPMNDLSIIDHKNRAAPACGGDAARATPKVGGPRPLRR